MRKSCRITKKQRKYAYAYQIRTNKKRIRSEQTIAFPSSTFNFFKENAATLTNNLLMSLYYRFVF